MFLKNIQIIGASGYIGRAICGALLRDHNVTALSRSMPSCLNHDDISFIPFDYVQNTNFYPPSKIDVLIHAASLFHPRDKLSEAVINENINNELLFIEQIRSLAIRGLVGRYIYISSGGEIYGEDIGIPHKEADPLHPITQYGRFKKVVEEALLKSLVGHCTFTSLRLTNPYGARGPNEKGRNFLNTAIHSALANKEIRIWGRVKTVRNFICIDDFIHALKLVIKFEGNLPPAINVGAKESISLWEAAEIISKRVQEVEIIVEKEDFIPAIKSNTVSTVLLTDLLGWQPRASVEANILGLIETQSQNL